MNLSVFTVLLVVARVTIISATSAKNGTCLLRSTLEPGKYWYQCVKSTEDYLSDAGRAPIDVSRVSFSSSDIPTIRDFSFLRLGKSLESLIFYYAGVEEIEDRAFRGLENLTSLVLRGNHLEIIRGAWFVALPRIKMIDLRNNRVKHVDFHTFANLPPIDTFDLSNNRLTELPIDSLERARIKSFYFRHNPFEWTCLASISKWLTETGTRSDEMALNNSGITAYNFDLPIELVKMCVRRSPMKKIDENYIDECVSRITREYLPTDKDYYTVNDVCQLEKVKLSPFIHCMKYV